MSLLGGVHIAGAYANSCMLIQNRVMSVSAGPLLLWLCTCKVKAVIALVPAFHGNACASTALLEAPRVYDYRYG